MWKVIVFHNNNNNETVAGGQSSVKYEEDIDKIKNNC